MVSTAPAWAVTASCGKWKIAEQGGATCTGSGGQWRLWLDCPAGFDYRSNWMTLSSTPTSVQGTCGCRARPPELGVAGHAAAEPGQGQRSARRPGWWIRDIKVERIR
ncbi:hypothetical protein [Amycolatopsis sp. MtRt-6]|uniref:hypothetical protein n=1 Tax=Amycolatopsis sp. MtRt-6 TaxID=2792782 RepID=UPI001A8CEE10|nr:hypothetical protein [Amycolatopsis sp. MtRt-6]